MLSTIVQRPPSDVLNVAAATTINAGYLVALDGSGNAILNPKASTALFGIATEDMDADGSPVTVPVIVKTLITSPAASLRLKLSGTVAKGGSLFPQDGGVVASTQASGGAVAIGVALEAGTNNELVRAAV